MLIRTILFIALLALLAPAAEHVIIVSIDGFAAYHLNNQELLLPNIRELIAEGVWASSSETVFPSVTHPSHTTILTGVPPRIHGVLSNGLLNRDTGESFHPTNKPRTEIVKVPTLFDAAKAKDMRTAAFFWPETRDDPAVDFNIPEVFDSERRAEIRSVKPEILDELRNNGVAIDHYFDWYGTPRKGAGDMVLAEAAAYAIRGRKPNLLAIHLVSTDSTQHEHGPHHYLSQAALTMADSCVGILRQAVRDAGIANSTTFFIAADHGFHSVYEEVNIRPVFAAAGLLGKVKLHGGGWSMAVELTGDFDRTADQPKLDAVFARLIEGKLIRRVVSPDEMHDLGQPRFEESPYVRGQYLLVPDIDTHLVADPVGDSTERRKKQQPYHGHGFLPQHPRMHPALVISGAGARRGVTIGHVRNLDIAPTVAHLLGLELNGTTGRVLEEVFATDPPPPHHQ
ncbi:MAG: alkaline phosphatase family protein [bacterium]|nr:alkaline phosphatase family protein [bacterium]